MGLFLATTPFHETAPMVTVDPRPRRILPLLSFALLALTANNANAQVFYIAPQNQVYNPTSYCGWAAVETVARHQGITRLHGLTAHQMRTTTSGLAYQRDLINKLQQLGIAYDARLHGSYDYAFVQQALARQRGVVVTLRSLTGNPYDHNVVLTGLTPQAAYTVNPDRAGTTIPMSRQIFDARWRGDGLILTGRR